MSLQRLERLAVIASIAILVAGLVFWGFQVGDVIELLEMAYGE